MPQLLLVEWNSSLIKRVVHRMYGAAVVCVMALQISVAYAVTEVGPVRVTNLSLNTSSGNEVKQSCS